MPRSTGHISVVAVGRLRERHWLAAQESYSRRLNHYTDFKLIEVKDAVGKTSPDSVAIAREGEQLLAAMPRGSRLILMAANGRQMDSPELAVFLRGQLEAYGDLAFMIGGPLGFDTAVDAAAHDRLALSRLTFPHELARVILLEQLYRAFTLINGESYHK